jgi:O-antigen/teichoic acid export membrane protein
VSEGPGAKGATWSAKPERQLATVARNISTRYVAILCETVLGLIMLPFNLNHLGAAQYGLWMLVGSVTVHFSVLDMGYGGSLVKFVAYYRARRDRQALNEIASTMFFVLASFGIVAYAIAALVAFNLGVVFPKITPEQAELGKWLLLIIGIHVALAFPFGIFGGITSGFQRYDANSMVAIATSTTVALVNLVLLWLGYSLLTLVAWTTGVRVIAYFVYRMNAYRAYPDLRIRPALFRRARLKEVTGFSIYSAVIDWANKLNYQLDQLVVGAFLGSAAVAVWAVAERIVWGTQRLTNQLNGVLFPVIVSSDATNDNRRLQQILQQGTLLSLATVVPIAVALVTLADPLIRSWTRNAEMAAAVPVLQILAVAVAVRVGNATGSTVLKGSGQHRLLAFTNLGAGVVNIVLSIVLVRVYGIVGVAIGTVIPIAAAAVFILNPAACRRVGLPISQLVLRSVIPALWPGLVMGGALIYTRSISSGTFLAVAIQAAAGGVLYLALLVGIAIGRRNRALYLAKAKELLGRRGHRAAVPTAARPAGNNAV